MNIRKITKDDVMSYNYKPDPHTVTLKDNGEWWGLFDNHKLVTCVCIRPRLNEMHIREVYTIPEYRRKGCLYKLASYIVNEVYGDYQISIHCLAKSKGCFEKLGFECFSFRHFPYGDQWWLRRSGRILTKEEKAIMEEKYHVHG